MTSTVTTKPTKGVRGIGMFAIIAGIFLIAAGGVTWGVIASELSAEKITVSSDADMFAGRRVNGPLTAYAEAQVIAKHAEEIGGGKTYAELPRDDPNRETVMDASFLRASLFTSVVAFGVAAMAMGLGLLFLMMGIALRRLSRGIAGVGGGSTAPAHAAPAHSGPAEPGRGEPDAVQVDAPVTATGAPNTQPDPGEATTGATHEPSTTASPGPPVPGVPGAPATLTQNPGPPAVEEPEIPASPELSPGPAVDDEHLAAPAPAPGPGPALGTSADENSSDLPAESLNQPTTRAERRRLDEQQE